MNAEQDNDSTSALSSALSQAERHLIESEKLHKKTLKEMADKMDDSASALSQTERHLIETEKLHEKTLKAMADKVAEMESAYIKTIAQLENMVGEQAVALEDAQIVQMVDQPKGDPEQVKRYRLTVLTDLHRDRGMPATDHPALHEPDLSEDDWPGTAAERKALAPKIKVLHAHLKRHPMAYRHIVKRASVVA